TLFQGPFLIALGFGCFLFLLGFGLLRHQRRLATRKARRTASVLLILGLALAARAGAVVDAERQRLEQEKSRRDSELKELETQIKDLEEGLTGERDALLDAWKDFLQAPAAPGDTPHAREVRELEEKAVAQVRSFLVNQVTARLFAQKAVEQLTAAA